MKRHIIPILALLLTSLVSTSAADAPEHGIISVTPAKRLEDAFVTGNPIPPVSLGSDEDKMKVAVNAFNDTIQSLSYKMDDGWVDVPYRADSEAGPAWLGVDMLPVVPGKTRFSRHQCPVGYSASLLHGGTGFDFEKFPPESDSRCLAVGGHQGEDSDSPLRGPVIQPR